MNLKKHKWLPILLIILVVVAVFAHWCLWKKSQKFSSYGVVQTQNTRQDSTQDLWKTYSSPNGDYKVSYPIEAKISFIDRGSEPARCTQIKYGQGYVLLNNKSSDPCSGSTGVGAEDKKVTETIVIDGKSYSSSGFVSPGNKSSFAQITFNDDLLVTYGVVSGSGMSDAEYVRTINSLKTIMATLR